MQTQHQIKRDASPNAPQLHAIQTTECPLLIIAGPGSGKTYTLVERAFYLITEKNNPPKYTFISTFIEKVASKIINPLQTSLPKITFLCKEILYD